MSPGGPGSGLRALGEGKLDCRWEETTPRWLLPSPSLGFLEPPSVCRALDGGHEAQSPPFMRGEPRRSRENPAVPGKGPAGDDEAEGSGW